MISPDSYVTVRNGRVAILPTSIHEGGVQRQANPQPVWRTPSSSSIIPHTSVMSNNEIDKSSWAFVARRFHANLKAINNWNANGRLNA